MSEKVIVEVGANDEATPVLNKTADNVESMSSRISGSLKEAEGVSKGFALALASIGGGILAGMGVAFNAALGAQQTMIQANVTLETMGKKGHEAQAGLLAAAQGAVKLGFDDEDAYLSLTKLFQRTGNVTEAMKLQHIAMDLSRAKTIDLAQASNMVGMVMSGNGKILKQYGIDLKDSATPMEALAELQKKVAGQSDAFAQSVSGQIDILKVEFGNFLETVGAPILDWVGQFLEAFQNWVESMGGAEAIAGMFITKLQELGTFLQEHQIIIWIIVGAIVGGLVPALYASAAAIAANVVALAPFLAIGAAVAAVAYVMYEAWSNNWFGIRDKVTEVISFLMPYLTAFVVFLETVWQQIMDGIDLVKFAWENNMYGIQQIATTVWEGIKQFFIAWWEIVKGIFQVAFGLLTNNWKMTWEGIKSVLKGATDLLLMGIELLWTGIKGIFSAGMTSLSNGWSSMLNGISGLASSIWEGIKNTFKTGINAIIEYVNGFIRSYNNAVSKVPGLKKLAITEFTPLAEGGIVTQPTFALIGEAGPEAVIPLNRAKNGAGSVGGGITIHVSGNNFYGDDEDFAQRVGDAIVRAVIPNLSFQTT